MAVVLGYVLVAGNPWIGRQLDLVRGDFDEPFTALSSTLLFPRWQVDLERTGAWMFWYQNIRTLLFTVLAVVLLTRLARSAKPATGVFAAMAGIGATALSATVASVAASLLTPALLGPSPWSAGSEYDSIELFLSPLSQAALFGALLGLVVGMAVSGAHRAPAGRPGTGLFGSRPLPADERRTTPKSFW